MNQVDLATIAVALAGPVLAIWLHSRARRAIDELRRVLQGFCPVLPDRTTWDQLGLGIQALKKQLIADRAQFEPELILGVNGGGTALADMLSDGMQEELGRRLPVFGVSMFKPYRNPETQPSPTDDARLQAEVKGKRVLLVEDFFLGGTAVTSLLEQLRSHGPKELRLLVFAVPNRYVDNTDNRAYIGGYVIHYYCARFTRADFAMPWHD
jgi:pyrimidine operon attenuation protein/uracil phosphoribosyltransferase